MSVTTIDWLLWMSGTVSAYWLVPARHRDLVISGATAAFLAIYAPTSAFWFAAFVLSTFYLTDAPKLTGRRILLVGAFIVVVLVAYKATVGRAAAGEFMTEAAMPLGLSYCSFRCLHYLIERYRGTLAPHGFRQYVGFLFFLPTVIAGPIHRAPAFLRDAKENRWDAGMLSNGFERIVHGYAKIVILGNYVISSWLAGWIAGLGPEHEALAIYLRLIQRYLNLYFQFSGYSDVAIGFAMLLGYRILENFRWPIVAPNIADFWRRWHMSLTSWVREYIFMVVLATWRRPELGSLCSMLIIGMWHELSLRYLLWGVYHALGIVVWNRFQTYKRRLPRIRHEGLKALLHGLAVFATFQYVTLGFALNVGETIPDAFQIWWRVLLAWWL